MNPFQNYTEKLVKSFDFKILRYVDFFCQLTFATVSKSSYSRSKFQSTNY